MRIIAQFSDPDRAPYRDIAVRRVRAGRDGRTMIALPADWPLSAAEELAFLPLDHGRGAGLPAGTTGRPLPDFLGAAADGEQAKAEPSVLATLDRLALRWARWGWRLGLFADAPDARAFFDDIRWLLARRAIAPDRVAWLGAAGAQALRGYGVDPVTGAVQPAHALTGFAPLAPAPADEHGPVARVVRLIREAVDSRTDGAAEAQAPAITLDPLRFVLPSGALDPAALAAAARLAALAADIEVATRASASEAQARATYSQRPIAIGLANLGAFVTSQGLACDSAAGRALAQAVCGLVTAAAAATSTEIAAAVGPCAAFTAARRRVRDTLGRNRDATTRALARLRSVARPAHLAESAAAIAAAARPLWSAAMRAEHLRHTRFTALAPAPQHHPLPLDIQSPGAGPLRQLVCDRELADGGFARIVPSVVVSGLAMLGYDTTVQAAAIRQLRGHRSLAGAPGVSLEALRAKGLDEAALARIEAAVAEARDIRHVITRWTVGADLCERLLGAAAPGPDDYGFDMLAALGFDAAAVEAANRHCMGSDSLAGTPGLAAADAAVLSVPAEPARAEAAMIAAVNAVLSVAATPPGSDLQPAGTAGETASAADGLALAAADRS